MSGAPHHLPTEMLEVTIFQANNLKHLNHWVVDKPYCVCAVEHQDKREHATKVQTKPLNEGINPLDPEWHETFEVQPWHQGDDLLFTIYDKGFAGSRTEGAVHVRSE